MPKERLKNIYNLFFICYNKSKKSKKIMKKQQFVWSVTVTSKGQISLPKQAREVFKIKDGDTLLLLGDTEKGLAIVNQEQSLAFANAVLDATRQGGAK